MWQADYIMPKTAALRAVDPPRLRTADDVRIRVAYAGICQDDLLIYNKDRSYLEWPGLQPVVGHEFSGIILETGENAAASGWRPGDRVSGLAWSFCGTCYSCKNGMENHCLRQQVVSVFANEIVMNQRQLCRLPPEISLQEGVFTDPVSYCLYSDLQHSGSKPYPNVLIFGTSAMALIMLQLARLEGAATVTVVEANPRKAALARSLGAGLVIDPRRQNVVFEALRHTGDVGYHTVYEMAHNSKNLETATKVLAFQGSILISSMYDSNDLSLSELFLKEGTVRTFTLAAYMLVEASRVMPRLQLAPLITRVFPFEQINEAFHVQEQDDSVKVLLRVSPPEDE